MKIPVKYLFWGVLFITPYLFSIALLLSMNTRQAVYDWLSSQINLASIVSSITLMTVVGYRISVEKAKKKFEERTKVIEKKFNSVQRDANEANRGVFQLNTRVSKLEGEFEVLKDILTKKI